MATKSCWQSRYHEQIYIPATDVRSGEIRHDTGALKYPSLRGHVWSRLALGYGYDGWASRAYTLYAGDNGTNPSSSDARWYGLPVRCLVY